MPKKRPLEWTLRSQSNIESIRERIAADNPAAARAVLAELRKTANSLRDFPMLGRGGRNSGTREIVLGRYPCTIVYRLVARKVRILTVVHQSQQYP